MNKKLLALRLLGRPIRLMSVKGQDRIAMLRFEVTPFANERTKDGVKMRSLGCELTLVIFSPKKFGKACKKGTVIVQGEKRTVYSYRIRNLTPSQLRRLAFRMLEYAELLEIASISGIDLQELRKTWRKIRKQKTVEEEEIEEEEFGFNETEEEEEEIEETEEEESESGGEIIERD